MPNLRKSVFYGQNIIYVWKILRNFADTRGTPKPHFCFRLALIDCSFLLVYTEPSPIYRFLPIPIRHHSFSECLLLKLPHDFGRVHIGSGSVPDSSEPYASGRLRVGFAFTLLTTVQTRTVRVRFAPCTYCVCFATGCDPITCT